MRKVILCVMLMMLSITNVSAYRRSLNYFLSKDEKSFYEDENVAVKFVVVSGYIGLQISNKTDNDIYFDPANFSVYCNGNAIELKTISSISSKTSTTLAVCRFPDFMTRNRRVKLEDVVGCSRSYYRAKEVYNSKGGGYVKFLRSSFIYNDKISPYVFVAKLKYGASQSLEQVHDVEISTFPEVVVYDKYAYSEHKLKYCTEYLDREKFRVLFKNRCVKYLYEDGGVEKYVGRNNNR